MKKNKFFFFILFSLSLLFYTLSQPSIIFSDGISFCAWGAYIPLFVLLEQISLSAALFLGFLFGTLLSCTLFFWLSSFGFIALTFVSFLFALFYSILFFFIVLSKKIFPESAVPLFWIFRAFLILTAEFLRIHGLFSFPYGNIAYSQWKNPFLLNLSSYMGVWGVTLFILLVNSYFASLITEKKILNKKYLLKGFSLFFCIYLFSGISFFVFKKIFSKNKSVGIPIALIQCPSTAKSSGIDSYEKDFLLLKNLSEKALSSHPNTELIVWPETAFVPDFMHFSSDSSDRRRHKLSLDLIDFLNNSHVSFIIGSNYGDERGIHNSAIFYDSENKNFQIYNKIHLVPFTEKWPAFFDSDIFTPIKKSLNCDDFAPGKDIKVFPHKSFRFAVPICFEDSFSSFIKDMKFFSCDFFVNISDDAWAGSKAEKNMHLAMSVFRSAEEATPFARSTIDGMTCIIDAHGSIVTCLECGSDDFLFGIIEPVAFRSLYSLIGDIPVIFITVTVLFALLILSAVFVKVKLW